MARRWRIRLLFALIVLALGVMSTSAVLRAVGFVITDLTVFAPANGPIGIDQIVCGGQSGGLVVSVNWPTGSPNNLRIFDAGGNAQNFSSLAGRATEIKVAAVQNGLGSFTPGDVFVGSGGSGTAGDPAGIVKVSSNGATVDPWVTFPLDGLVVGSMFHDRYGVFGGDLIVVLTNDEGPNHESTSPAGQVWRVTSGGGKTLLATATQHLEGVTTIPEFAPEGGGRILVGGSDRIFVIDTAGGVKTIGNVAGADYPTTTPLRPEDLDVIPDSGTFYGVDFGTGNNDGRILTAPVNGPFPGIDFAASAGAILVTTEIPDSDSGQSGLNVLSWNGTSFDYDQVLNTGLVPVHWEHVTFASDIHECPQPEITITKGPGQSTITAGQDDAVFTIVVTNNGPGTAQNVEITDPLPTAPGGLVWTTSTPGCTVTGNTLTCSLGNIAASSSVTVTVSAPTSSPANCGVVTNHNAHASADNALAVDSGPAALTVSCPSITIVKLTNGTDNDTGTGPVVPVGSTVTWTYNVTNTGDVTLTGVTVTDDIVGFICTVGTLAPSAAASCTMTGTATAGQYTNTGTVTGTPPTGPTVTNSNVDHYFGQTASIAIVKLTNGTNNDTGTGPVVLVGSTVTWTYNVTNTGNVTLTNVTVTDDIVGFICTIGTLAPSAAASCTKTGTATAGQYTNIGTATGTPPTGPNVSASNVDHYFGSTPPPGVSHGCTPGFWKTHASNPPWGSYTPGQKVGTIFVFPVPPYTASSSASFSNETLLTALAGGGGAGLTGKTKILLRAAIAALLNADNGNPPYPLTVAQIQTQVQAALNSGNQTTMTNLAATLDNYNNQCDQ